MKTRVDFGKTAKDYRNFRAGFPREFFAYLDKNGLALPGQKVLDIGTGTGSVARGMAQLGASVEAIDPSVELIEQAKELDQLAGVLVQYHKGIAEDLPFAEGSFDVVMAGQCWHWFDSLRAFGEVHRVLKSSGRLIIAHFDWLPYAGSVPELTESLILKYNPHWAFAGRSGFYPEWARDAYLHGGFADVRTTTFDISMSYTRESWRGRIRASAGISASHLNDDAIKAFDTEHEIALKEHFPNSKLPILHRVFILTALRADFFCPKGSLLK